MFLWLCIFVNFTTIYTSNAPTTPKIVYDNTAIEKPLKESIQQDMNRTTALEIEEQILEKQQIFQRQLEKRKQLAKEKKEKEQENLSLMKDRQKKFIKDKEALAEQLRSKKISQENFEKSLKECRENFQKDMKTINAQIPWRQPYSNDYADFLIGEAREKQEKEEEELKKRYRSKEHYDITAFDQARKEVERKREQETQIIEANREEAKTEEQKTLLDLKNKAKESLKKDLWGLRSQFLPEGKENPEADVEYEKKVAERIKQHKKTIEQLNKKYESKSLFKSKL